MLLFFTKSCQNYRFLESEYGIDYEIDAKTRVAMAFSIITPTLGGIFCVVAAISPCCNMSQHIWKLMGAVFVLVSACQGISLIVVNSSICYNNPVHQALEQTGRDDFREILPDESEWSQGFRLGITAVVFWFVAGAMALVFPAPTPDSGMAPPQSQTVTYTKEEHGAAKGTNVAVVKGENIVDDNVADADDNAADGGETPKEDSAEA